MFPIFPAKRPFQRSSLVCDVADHSLSLCQKYNALIRSCNLRLKFIYAVAQHAIAIAFLFRAALIQRVLGLTRVAIRDTFGTCCAILVRLQLRARFIQGAKAGCF
jgi:hypothetical protein